VIGHASRTSCPGHDSDPARAPVSRASAASAVRVALSDERLAAVDHGTMKGCCGRVAPGSSSTIADSIFPRSR
jgi:hypothetical protein